MRIIKIAFASLFLFSALNTNAQFLSKLSFGFKGGINFSFPLAKENFSVFTDAASPAGQVKEYENLFKNMASHYHFLMYYRMGDLSYIGILPGWYNYNYKYQTKYDWTGAESFTTRFEYKQHNAYLDIPFVFKQKIKRGSFQPYIQLGAYYSLLVDSKKSINTFETESAFNTSEYELPEETVPTDINFLKSHAGVIGGIGFGYQIKRITIALESDFRYNFHNIADTHNRIKNYRTLGKYYDINDDLNLMNWSISLAFIVDLKCVPEKIPARYDNLYE